MSWRPRDIDLPGSLLIVLGLWVLGLAGKRFELVVPLMVLVGLRVFVGGKVVWRGSPPPRDGVPPLLPLRPIPALILAVPFAALSLFWEVEGRSGLGLNMPFHISLYLQALAIFKLYAPPDSRRFGVLLFCGAAAVATCGLDVKPDQFALFALGFLVFALAGLLGAVPVRRVDAPEDPQAAARLSRIYSLSACGVALALALGCTQAIRSNERKIFSAYMHMRVGLNRMLLDRLPDSPGGFSDAAALGNLDDMRGRGGRTIALRAQAARGPGYLRGRAFRAYERGSWASRKEGILIPSRRTPGRIPLPTRPRPERRQRVDLRVWTSPRYGSHLFLPLDAAAVETGDRVLTRVTGNAVKQTRVSSSDGYGVLRSPEPVRDSTTPGELESEWLAVPEVPELRAALARTAAKCGLSPGLPSARAVTAIRRYFATTYTYKIGIEFEDGRDPLSQFLDDKNHGHCELFASAGTLLLRRLGIRARYVTGFLCLERSAIDEDLWVARNEHAHAWVEVYDEDAGWTVAEFTPPGAMPRRGAASGGEAFLDWLGGLWERIKALFQDQGLGGLLKAALARVKGGLAFAGRWVLGAWWRIAAPALLIALAAAVVVWRRRRRSAPSRAKRPVRAFGEALAVARQDYLALERRLAGQGFGRQGRETLLEYAERLAAEPELPDAEPTLAAIQGFSALRYAKEPEA